jgi:uncharacterized damage-inducible protein DinB
VKQYPVEILLEAFENNQAVLELQAEGITHEQSLLKLPFYSNCMNWVLGHLLQSRSWMLEQTGLSGYVPPEEAQIYQRNAPEMADPEQASRLESLLERLKETNALLKDRLEAMSPEELHREIPIFGGTTLSAFLGFLLWHETYHVGQLEILRNFAGRHEKLI